MTPTPGMAFIRTLLADERLATIRAKGACRGRPDVNFFPERGERTGPAKAVCATCEVREDCLGYALDTVQKHGIWGGLSERERRRIRSRRWAEVESSTGAILRVLAEGPVSAPEGGAMGALSRRTGIALSTITRPMRDLEAAGEVVVVRTGRNVTLIALAEQATA